MKIIEGQEYISLCSIDQLSRTPQLEISTLEEGIIVIVQECSHHLNPTNLGDIVSTASFINTSDQDEDKINNFVPVDIFMACFERVSDDT